MCSVFGSVIQASLISPLKMLVIVWEATEYQALVRVFFFLITIPNPPKKHLICLVFQADFLQLGYISINYPLLCVWSLCSLYSMAICGPHKMSDKQILRVKIIIFFSQSCFEEENKHDDWRKLINRVWTNTHASTRGRKSCFPRRLEVPAACYWESHLTSRCSVRKLNLISLGVRVHKHLIIQYNVI